MSNRRDFIKKAALAAGALGFAGTLPESIQRAMAINPATGSTFMDAEHIVILMQENRSFDHLYGTLKGVRGFNDPRAITLPDQKPVWLQTNEAGETYGPFRLNIKDTRATWMGSLPHSWTNQVDARNSGKMDKWLHVKKSGHAAFAKMPLTMGYYNREDVPFYYAMADAFTVCDQNFCSSLTGTTPNRLYFWSGTIREAASEDVQPRVNNEDADYNTEVSWKTFPERLEEHGVSWKFYQNELSAGVGFTDEEDAWLANFGDNPLEYFTQYQVRFLPGYIRYLPVRIAKLSDEITALKDKIKNTKAEDLHKEQTSLSKKQAALDKLLGEKEKYTADNFQNLPQAARSLHAKAFVTNTGDPDYHSLESLTYGSGAVKSEMKIPKGDVLHQFRSDVQQGALPLVSWLAAPENLSDHPSAPWYGAAYVSEVLDILTKDPAVWKKTIFILAYDENDGYFDHVPPFTAPYPGKPETGKVSDGIDSRLDYVTLEQDKKWRTPERARESPVGLGFRVPLIVASPWSRGGAVNSQVFDHTSVLQFLETFLTQKTGKKIVETNITSWRRAVCGNLTSVFKPSNDEKMDLPVFINANDFYRTIEEARVKKDPVGFHRFTSTEIARTKEHPLSTALLPKQEQGVKPSCALPYELSVDGALSPDKKTFAVTFKAGNARFGTKSAGAPFNVYSADTRDPKAYAVMAGDEVTDSWKLDDFKAGHYLLNVFGPNGFFRMFKGDSRDPLVVISVGYEGEDSYGYGSLLVKIENKTNAAKTIRLRDMSYNTQQSPVVVKPGASGQQLLSLVGSFGWYDISVTVEGADGFEKRYAGRVENGAEGLSDPKMGGVFG